MKTYFKGLKHPSLGVFSKLILLSICIAFAACQNEGFEEETLDDSTVLKVVSFNNGDAIALRADVNEKYVAAENGGSSSLIANRNAVNSWETFYINSNSDGTISLRSDVNDKYVTAENGGNAALIANRSAIGTWEKFDLIENSNGTVSLKALANNRYVTAENRGNAPLIANRTNIGLWEQFHFVVLSNGGGGGGGGSTGDTAAEIIGNGWKLNGFRGNLSVGSNDNGLDYADRASTGESHFFFENNGYATFRCYPGNPTSGGSSNPRSELREVVNGGDNYWDGTTGALNSMKWRFRVEDLPPSGKLCFGQIHERDNFYDDLIRVQVQGSNGQNSGRVDLRILGYVTEEIEGSGRTIDFDMNMDTEYYFELTLQNSVVRLYELNNSGSRVRTLFTSVNLGDVDENYFKAGSYLQSTRSSHASSNVFGQVAIKDLSVRH